MTSAFWTSSFGWQVARTPRHLPRKGEGLQVLHDERMRLLAGRAASIRKAGGWHERATLSEGLPENIRRVLRALVQGCAGPPKASRVTGTAEGANIICM